MLRSYEQRLLSEGTLTLNVRARPNARVTRITGVMEDGSLKADVHAAPEDGEANKELARHLAERFGVGISNVELLSGHRGRLKVFRVVR